MSAQPAAKPKLTMDDVMIIRSLIFKDGPPELPPPAVHYRHPLAHFDFWFLLIGLACVMATTTSMIDGHLLEPLIFTAIGFLLFALILNLSRDRQVVMVTKIIRPLVINWAPVHQSLKDLQLKHGITLVGGSNAKS